MPLRCLVLLRDAAAAAPELCARLRGALRAEVFRISLDSDPSSAPRCGIALLHLAKLDGRSELLRCLSARTRFHPRPCVAICEPSLKKWASDIARSGVDDFLFEPFTDEELRARVHRVSSVPAQVTEAAAPAVPVRVARNLIGSNRKFLEQVDRLAAYAACDATVLILGETGTGKEIFAQAVHYTSSRAADPWVAVNCGAIPHELIEDELFGHVRGAYTTAHGSRLGLVNEAEGGSLFLDDVDCLPLSAQAKLLRFLQEREFRAVGSNTIQRANVRVIAASNRELGRAAASGEFRQDLYFRLNVLPLMLPPLRERREDIASLALHFIRHFAHEFKRPVQGIAPAAMKRMLMHDWPGNVRELQHVIERAVLLARDRVLDAVDVDVGPSSGELAADTTFRSMKARVVAEFERGYIEHLLGANGGNVTHAARAAGKNRRAFFALMRKYRIASEPFRNPVVRRGLAARA